MDETRALELASKFGWEPTGEKDGTLTRWRRISESGDVINISWDYALCKLFASANKLMEIVISNNIFAMKSRRYNSLIEIGSHIAYKDIVIPYTGTHEFWEELFDLLYKIFVEKI